ncbi:hypothetical protein ACFPPA_06215 [Rhodanobacter ginsengisoli]|uniref:Uncharacterized protein n=1 Tax=Rhodanobacter ginsengisoli TaxID=418646 RepID=A0ABW0QKT6_9GAMM
MEKITYVVHVFQRGRKKKERHFATLEEAQAYAACLGTAFDCVVLAAQRPQLPTDAPEGQPQEGFLASFMRRHMHTQG